MRKEEQREKLKAIRRAMTAAEIAEKSSLIAEKFCSLAEFKDAESVFIYISLPKEVATLGIIEECLRRGKKVLVPVTTNGVVSLCLLESADNLITGEFGISEPKEKIPWRGVPDVAVIPGLGFDRKGGRMGFGKGCYDRFLAENNCVKIGLAFSGQLQPEIVTEPHDVAMDMVVTERETIIK